MNALRPIHIVGGGLAGSEAAWQIVRRGVPVVLHEMRPERSTAAHKTGRFAELVCSNSFRSDDAEASAIGLLHAEMRRLGVTPHVSQNDKGRRSAIDRRTTRHHGYAVSLRVRKRIEEVFGWIKTVGGLRKTRHRGTALVGWMFTLAAAAYNVVRIPKLLAAAA